MSSSSSVHTSSRSPLMSALVPLITWTHKRRRVMTSGGPVMSAVPSITWPYKRRRVVNSGLGNIALVDEQGIVHCGSNDGNLEDLEVQNSIASHDLPEVDCLEQIGKAASDGIKNNNDMSHGVNVESCSAFDNGITTPKASSVVNVNKNKYETTRKHPRKQNYWPKINDKTKPKKVPKVKKVKPSKRNMHESGMPQACHMADHSVQVPQTPEPLDHKGINLGDESITPIQTRSWRTPSCLGKKTCRKGLDFSNTVTDESVGCTDLVDSLIDVNAGKFKWIFESLNKDSEHQDFESCIGMKKIISEYKRGKLKSKRRSGIIIEDLKAALPLFSLSKKCRTPIKIPRRKRSKRNRPRKMLPVEEATSLDALENVAFDTMKQKCWAQNLISEDLLKPDLNSRCPTIPMDHVWKDGEANNALVPYVGRVDSAQGHEREADNALVPQGEGLDPLPCLKSSVKVDICPNTTKVWNLLMENDGGLDNTDENTKNWLEEEAKQLGERIDVFIACMNLIQGNRPFSYWRGSVLDSVFGVLLTQNVTDVLSSSSFMALAAKYPPDHRRKIEKESTFSRNENAKDFPQPQSNPHMESSCQESLPHNVQYPSSEHAHLNLLPDLNLPVNLNFSYSSLVHEESCVESSRRENDISRNGGCESSSSIIQVESEERPADYWYSIAKVIADAEAEKRNGKKKIPKQKKEVMPGKKEIAKQKKEVMPGKKKISKQKKEVVPGQKKIAKQKKEVMPKFDGGSNKKKGEKVEKRDKGVNWEELKQTYCTCTPRSYDSLDAVDWEAVRRASFKDVTSVIAGRGMQNLIAGRMKDLLDRLVKDHGSIDLEWLRDVPPIKVKDYLLSIDGIGLKSAECIRLLSLDHHAFPVDVNIGRIAVRLGWVPLLPFPDGVLIHLLDKYPLLDHIQKYLWPRLQGLDKSKLFELHYHLITFGKVFCKKKRPNCNACPMKGECRHFASAYASEKLSLPAPNKAWASGKGRNGCPTETSTTLLLKWSPSEPHHESVCEPIVEVPSSPEPQCVETPIRDIEDLCSERDDDIPTIALNTEAFRKNVQMELERRNCIHHDLSKALVSLTHESASISMQKKRVLRTEHVVYKLEDRNLLLAGFEERAPEDPNPYLFKVWTPDTEIEEQSDQMVLGTILIPCKTANEGRFPLSGTYFQTNEVFADDETSQNPISIPSKLLLKKNRRLLYCGTSASSIFTDCDLQKITYCFWKGFICVRGVDKITRAPKTLDQRLHKRDIPLHKSVNT